MFTVMVGGLHINILNVPRRNTYRFQHLLGSTLPKYYQVEELSAANKWNKFWQYFSVSYQEKKIEN